MKKNSKTYLFLALTMISQVASANTRYDKHLPISHCYHWLDENSHQYLTNKYDYAEKNKGELTFYTTDATSNGSIAGAGLYCAKSPSGSYSYGDRVIKIEFVEDVVLFDEKKNKQYCGLDGKYYKDQSICDSKPWDVKFYQGGSHGGKAWYVISNPQAVKRWSANGKSLVEDLNKSKEVNGYSFDSHIDRTLQLINLEIDKIGEKIVENSQARLALSSIVVNTPEKLDTIPALNLISRALSEKLDKLISKEEYEKFLRVQVKRISFDSKLSLNDILTEITNKKVKKMLLSYMIEVMNEEKQGINFSLFSYTFSKKPRKLKISDDYIVKNIEYMFENSPWKLHETLKQINKVGLFSSKNKKKFKKMFLSLFAQNADKILDLDIATYNSIPDSIGKKKFFSEEFSEFRSKVFTSTQAKMQALNSEDKLEIDFDEVKLVLDKSTSEDLMGSCKLSLLYQPQVDEIRFKAKEEVVTVESRRVRSSDEANEVCENVLRNVSTLAYKAKCISSEKMSFRENGRSTKTIGNVSAKSVNLLINKCEELAEQTNGVRPKSVGLYDVTPVMTGFPRLYRGECHLDDDDDFDAGQYVIGTVVGDSPEEVKNACHSFEEAFFPDGESSSQIEKFNMMKPMSSSIKVEATCHVDDDSDFDFDEIIAGTVYGKTFKEAAKVCDDITENLYASYFTNSLADIQFYSKGQSISKECHIDDDPDFDWDQTVILIKGESEDEFRDACKYLAERMHDVYTYDLK